MADENEPDDLDRRIERTRKRMDVARSDLMALIGEALDDGRSPTRVGRYAHWSDAYIKQIREKRRESTAN